LKVTPNYRSAHFELGFVYQQQGKYEQAVKEYEKMLPAESPDDINLHHNLVRCYIRLGRIEDAKRERAIVQRLRKLSDAIAAAQQKIRENPNDSSGYMELAGVYTENNLSNKALEIYIALLKSNPQAMDAYNGAATVYIQHDRIEDGLAIYEMAIKVEPEYLKGHLMIGLINLQHGKHEKSAGHLKIARKLALDAVEKTPNADNLYTLASIYYAIEDYVQAEAALQKAAKLAPENKQIQKHLNQVRQLRKRDD